MGPEYVAIAFTAVVSAVTGGSWAANKILYRVHQRLVQLSDDVITQENKLNRLQEQIGRMPMDYVLKVDFLREIQEMHDNFRQINTKLDKLMEKLLSK